MITTRRIFGALALSLILAAAPASAEEGSAVPEIQKQDWSFSGVFGKFDKDQLQRGFQVFREVCAGCHNARLLTFRNLREPGGPEFTEGQIKALAAEYEIIDPTAEGGKRPGTLADRWPGTGQSDADLAASFGVVPPDFSTLAKARGTTQPGLWWILNYFTAYQEGGPDYIHALLMGYKDEVPEGVMGSDGNPLVLADGKYFNTYFPGHVIGMPPPLSDGAVAYAEGEGGVTVPQTAEQYSEDVSAFLMWLADPHMTARKEAGFSVILFLLLFSGLMYGVKRRLWSKVEH